MRPRKNILVWASHEATAKDLGYVLDLHGYRSFSTWGDADSVRQIMHQPLHEFRVAVIFTNRDGGIAIPETVKSFDSCCAVVVIRTGRNLSEFPCADLILPYPTSKVQILNALRLLSQRKRGPRKGSVRQEASALIAEEKVV